MRYVINISPDEEKKITGLIEKGQVISIDHFIEVAIRNQLLLEADNIKVYPTRRKRTKKKIATKEKYTNKYELSKFTKRENLSIEPIESKTLKNQKSLIWGQIYRILPIKTNLRVLANIYDDASMVPLKKFEEIIFDLALQFGNKLREVDKDLSHKRGNKLATGFPTAVYGKLAKSRERYFSHYVGGLNKNLESDGCLTQLGFGKIFRNDNNDSYIQITNSGLDFALCENPILDQGIYHRSLTDEEISLYIKSVKDHLPIELNHMVFFLSAIEDGINGRNALNEKMKQFYLKLPDETVKWESLQVVNTMRTGLTGRMIELGFVGVQYNKQRAVYKIEREDWREKLS